MAVSGSIDFTVTRDDLIKEALEELGVIDIGATPSANDLASCGTSLNLMLKQWQADGVNLFAVQETYLFLQKDTSEYLLGDTAHFVTNFHQTTVSTAALDTDNTVELTALDGIADNDLVAIVQDDGTLHFTDLSSAPAANFIPITDALTSDVAIGNVVYHWTIAEQAGRPMKILDGVRRNNSATNSTDIPLDMLNRQEWVNLSNKDATGAAVQIYQNPELGSLRMHTWPAPNDVNHYYVLWVQRTLDDLDAAADNPAYPQEWQNAIALNLAVRVHRKYGVPSNEIAGTVQAAQEAYFVASGYDREESFTIVPASENNR